MTPTEIHALASQVIIDRLHGFGHNAASPVGKDGPVLSRFLAPTEAEIAWEAFIGPPRGRLTTQMVHPAVVKLAAQFKAAKAR